MVPPRVWLYHCAMRAILLVLVAAACSREPGTRSETWVALGWEGRVASALDLEGCGASATMTVDRGEVLQLLENGRARALSVGDATVRCRRGTRTFHVREPARVQISGRPATTHRRFWGPIGWDLVDADGRPLDAGDVATTRWNAAGALESAPGPKHCGHHDFVGPGLSLVLGESYWARSRGPGTGRLELAVALGGGRWQAAAAVVVMDELPPDGGCEHPGWAP